MDKVISIVVTELARPCNPYNSDYVKVTLETTSA